MNERGKLRKKRVHEIKKREMKIPTKGEKGKKCREEKDR
jgi:hypothetical protein